MLSGKDSMETFIGLAGTKLVHALIERYRAAVEYLEVQ